MAYTHNPYTESWSYPHCTEVQMEPEIKRSASPTSTASDWKANRFLTTDRKSPFLPHPAMDSTTSEIVTPYPLSHIQRPGSPSYTTSSSTCSSGLSPPTETDYCQVHSPQTPSDIARFTQYERWNSCQLYEFTGLAEGVSLGDVNPIHDVSLDFYDDNMQGFDFSVRTCSMSSDESNPSHHLWTEEEVPQHVRGLCIDSLDIKEEIHIPDTMESRHTPDMDDIESTNEPESPYVKIEPTEDEEEEDDQDDEEYSPTKKSKNTPTKSTYIGSSYKRRSTSQSSSDAKRIKTTAEQSLVVRPSTKPSIQGAKGQYSCPDCRKVSFKDRTGLDNHIKKQHTRPFTCIFEFADCRSTFASKNEWKRHCASQHIVLQYWVCQQDGCAQVSNKPNAPKRSSAGSRRRGAYYNRHATACPSSSSPSVAAAALPNGTIFNRKDLYTQHLRRMHVPAHLKSKVKSKTHVPEWEEQQRARQDEAVRTRCQLPTHMLCPAAGCRVAFQGASAWDDRMEHVAKHLEKVAAGEEPPLPFGGDNDATLVDWATSPEIGILRRGEKGGWMLQNPLKATGYYPVPPVVVNQRQEEEEDDDDPDAEGEDE
ncbi:hypothetical protein GGS24DRAFT_464532 [Hypoxylon argillaceum]|nr:hypothetical protein GGS24DRAFT_464532 [Hypoxylon argillaceum]